MADRSRRELANKADKFAELRKARQGGPRSWKEREAKIYDEVSENQYRSVVGGRQAQDDFIVDDGAEGYVDNGMDDWGEDEQYDSEDEDTRRPPKKKGASKTNASYSDYVRAKPKAPPKDESGASMSAYMPKVSKEEESDFMASLLGDVSALPAPVVPPRRTRKRKDYSMLSDDEDAGAPPTTGAYRSRPRKYRDADSSSDGYEGFDAGGAPSDDDRTWATNPRKKARVSNAPLGAALDGLQGLEVKSDHEDFDASFDGVDMDAFMDVDEDAAPPAKANGHSVKKEDIDAPLPKPPRAGVNGTTKKEEPNAQAWLKVYDSLTVSEPLGSGVAKSASTGVAVQALEDDGSLRFFWLDYLEHEGKLYFVGKVRDRANGGAWASACVTVENLQRNLFVLPRDRRVEEQDWSDVEDEDEEDEEMDEDARTERKLEKMHRREKARKKGRRLVETDEVPQLADVYNDFEKVRKAASVKKWRGKFVKRRYAFAEKDVPKEERQWLKVVYGFDEPQISNDASSPNFSRIFGTNTTAFELLVLKRKIQGPCWLQIKKPHVEHKGISWCKFEATIVDPKDFNPFAESDPEAPKDMPPLTVMSLTIRTIVNHRENKREIVCATSRLWSNLNIDDPTPPESLPASVTTFVRPLDRFPPNFEAKARANARGAITPVKTERTLLNNLLVTIHKADPDVIVGHEFLGVSLDVLLNRMKDLKADHWSRIGRFRRSKWPNIGRQGTNMKFLNGRLLCDLASDGAKSMIASTTWSLTEMCKTHLKSERQDIDPDDTASYFDGSVGMPDHLLTFVRHCELDAHYQMAIASKVQILPLTKQLTNLAGNSWNKTLNGGRAERNEYILLHEFHRLKYICPDKSWGKKFKPEPLPDEADGAKGTKGKRDKYKGGLVFEPKRGLWDKFILVMDFNSLYPSIIQEYNIDFTTVSSLEEDEDGEEKIPEPPSSDVPQGVLPRLIATLVQRRRQVKALMKDRTVTPARMMQYDIKQMALKLTANSMYGCLGFELSRFYARPLAALTTFKGREILTHTRELAESLQLDVVYGDTDSVFVNSNVTELSEALKISAEFKKAVNDRYKLLEIDLDGVFQRLLLLQKKKYAAIKVDDGTRRSVEVKGLDMKRREYCALSKSVSQYVLDQILSGEMTEVVVERIHEYLTIIGANVREGKIKLDEFIVFKRLGKDPEQYPDAKTQPHVQVALRMKARGGSAKAGDVIPYIFCIDGVAPPKEEDEKTEGKPVIKKEQTGGSKTSQAERAKHPDEIKKAGSGLVVDYEHYLSHQVLPPIERLCEPIEGTDRARLAECLGLDPGRYRSTTSAEGDERAFTALDSQQSDRERFKDCSPFVIKCRKCKGELPFAPITDRDSSVLSSAGASCPSCQAPFTLPSLQTQLESQLRIYIGKYYEGWTICDDQTCGNRTRMMSVYGRRCLRTGCRGNVSFEYSDAQLYTQLRYFASLFDAEKGIKSTQGTAKSDGITALVNMNAELLHTMSTTVEKYMDQSGRRWVDMTGLFSFMNV